MGLPKAKVHFKVSFKVIILLDTNEEINIIIKKLFKDANLAIKQVLKLELVSYTGHSCLFLVFVKM